MRISPQSLAFTFLLGAFAALPPLSIDMGLPALDLLQTALGASEAQASATLSLFLTGFALSQLVMGPLSDRFGRRPVMLIGMGLYVLAGIGCTFATSATTLLGFRLLAGVGAAAGTVLALAVARDVYEGHVARVKISSMSMVITIAPIIAPTFGALMLLLGGWRFIYGALTTVGVALVLAAWFALPETHPPTVGARLDIIGRYGAVLRQRRTVGYTTVNMLLGGGMFAYISSSSLVLMGRMGVSAPVFAALFATTAGGIMVGSSINTFLARRHVRASIPLAIGLITGPIASLAATAVLLAGIERAETYVPFVIIVGISRGLATPNATHAALEPLPTHAGVASALIGCSQMLAMSASAALVAAVLPQVGPLAVTLMMLVCNLGALVAWRLVERAAPR